MSTDPKRCYIKRVEGVKPTHKRPNSILTQMTVDFSKDVMLGMLRKGQTGTQILDILNVIVPEQTELTREQVCDELGIADCPENDDEIARAMSAV
jgi:hypothetical protein